MSISFKAALGDHPAALALRAQRAEVLSANLANADTPGYLAKDIPFAQVMAGLDRPSVAMTRTHAAHQQGVNGPLDGGALYRVPTQPSVDGNTVDAEQEMARFAENNAGFQASLTFLEGKFRTLNLAIRGE